MAAVHETIQDRIRQGRIVDETVPIVDRHLAGHDGGASADAIIQHLQQVGSAARAERIQAKVIENQQLAFRQLAAQLANRAISVCDRHLFQQSPHAPIAHGQTFARRLHAERACQPGFAVAGLLGNQHILPPLDPRAPTKEAENEPAPTDGPELPLELFVTPADRSPPVGHRNAIVCPQCDEWTWRATREYRHCGFDLFEYYEEQQQKRERRRRAYVGRCPPAGAWGWH